MDQMWTYWRDKYGIEIALKEYYPEILKSDPVLSFAMAQLETAELAINARMAELSKEVDNKG
jgi:hypothetical protein